MKRLLITAGMMCGIMLLGICPSVAQELPFQRGDVNQDGAVDISDPVSALFHLSSDTELRLSAGRFYQPEQIHELQAADGVDTFQPAQYADHYIVALQHVFADSGLSMRLEGFHKRFREPKRRFEK